MSQARGNVKDPQFEESARQLFSSDENVEVVLSSIEYALGMDPDLDKYEVVGEVDGIAIRAYKSPELPNIPCLVLIFSVTDPGLIRLHDIMLSE